MGVEHSGRGEGAAVNIFAIHKKNSLVAGQASRIRGKARAFGPANGFAESGTGPARSACAKKIEIRKGGIGF